MPTTLSRTSRLLHIVLYIHAVCGLPSSASLIGPGICISAKCLNTRQTNNMAEQSGHNNRIKIIILLSEPEVSFIRYVEATGGSQSSGIPLSLFLSQ